jgi:ABC-type methionine transport system permease subunit
VITAYRLPLLPGPIVAVQIVSGAAMVGMAGAAGRGHVSAQALQRFAIDAVLIFVAGLLVFWLKERLVHRRVLT